VSEGESAHVNSDRGLASSSLYFVSTFTMTTRGVIGALDLGIHHCVCCDYSEAVRGGMRRSDGGSLAVVLALLPTNNSCGVKKAGKDRDKGGQTKK
jgi:hypothetical protein